MFRDLVSYLVLILVPVVSLAIAIVPFVVVKNKLKSLFPSVIASDRKGAKQSHSDAQNEIAFGRRSQNDYFGEVGSSKTPRNDSVEETGTYPRPSASNPRVSALSWGAFVIGLVGNVVWWWLIFLTLNNEKASIYLGGAEVMGTVFGFTLYSIFIITTPFIFYKMKHGHFSGKAVVYNLIVSLLTAGIVLGIWIVLAVIAYRGLFEQLT